MGARLLFQFRSTPSYGFFGMSGGSSISVYSNGKVIERKYVMGNNKAIEERTVACVSELAEIIECLIISNKDVLDKIPENLNNGTLDGSHDCLKFGDKGISAWSIHLCDIEEVKERNPSYYLHYKDNMEYENMVVSIYNEIANTINTYIKDANMRIY